jgi:hypothetical protein
MQVKADAAPLKAGKMEKGGNQMKGKICLGAEWLGVCQGVK